jgi:hypothetical protein
MKLTRQYPNVVCDRHHKEEPGYIVCNHVMLQKAKVANSIPATSASVGFIFCGLGNAEAHPIEEMNLCCASCARQQGWI